jgi:methylated-DNA-[protein]-cysteine S-methyltransferase
MLERLRSRFSRLALKRRRDPNGYATRVRAYFSGDLGALDEIAVDSGRTPLQEQVWTTLRKIPIGTITTYSEFQNSRDSREPFAPSGSRTRATLSA